MNSRTFKHVIISAVFIWSMGLLGLIGSYFFSLIPDAAQQSIWVQSLVFIPAALIGAHIFYRKGFDLNGFLLGMTVLLVMIVLDVVIKVPLFLMPHGVTYVQHFLDFNYWLLGVEVVTVVAAYWQIEQSVNRTQSKA